MKQKITQILWTKKKSIIFKSAVRGSVFLQTTSYRRSGRSSVVNLLPGGVSTRTAQREHNRNTERGCALRRVCGLVILAPAQWNHLYSAIMGHEQDSRRTADRAEAATAPNHRLSQLTRPRLGWDMHTTFSTYHHSSFKCYHKQKCEGRAQRLTFHGHGATPQMWASLANEQTKCKTQRSLIVPCLACYHHFAAGKPERTAAAVPQRLLGSVGSALSGK